MTIAVPAALAGMPARLSALLQGLPDTYIDAEIAEAVEEGLYDDLAPEAMATALRFYRIEMLAEELASMADALKSEADGTAAERRRVEAMSDEERAAHDTAETKATRACMDKLFADCDHAHAA